MIKSIEKLKVRIDQNLNRAEKSEALSENVTKIESKVTSLKQLCQSVAKKLSTEAGTSSSAGSGKLGTDGAALEKRIRKTPEFALGQTFQENGRAYGRHSSEAGLSQFLLEGGVLLNDLAAGHVQYEVGVEKLVLQPLLGLVDEHGPPMAKERKNLTSLLLEYDAAKSRLANHRNKENSIESDVREERLSTELNDIESKVNSARDSVELLMLQFLSKESEVGTDLLRYMQLRRDYHSAAAERISQRIEQFQTLLNSPSVASPVYGYPLEDHLRRSGACVAVPLRTCVCRLLQLNGLEEEGLFRVASSTLKIKRLAALFDTCEATDTTLLQITDPHVYAGALKLYLRELPSPLLGQDYNRWMSECSSGGEKEKRREAIDAILASLPQARRHNLHYLLKFLKLVADYSDVNKMTPANISIVMAPNLLWNSQQNADNAKRDLSQTNIVNDIVEMLVDSVDYFFRGFGSGDIDFFREVTLEKPPIIKVSNKEDNGGHKEATVKTPVPRPRQSRAPKPPTAPKPADRQSVQPVSNQGSTHL